MLESFGGKYSITELDKATQYYTNDPNAKYSDLTGEANRALRDKVRSNLKSHKGLFVIPGTEFLVQEKTAKLNEFLKGKKTIKQTELIKKLEELGYKTPKLYVNTLKKQRGLHIIRDAEKVPHPLRESKLYSKTELNKAAKDIFEGKKYDSLNPTERKVIQGKLFHTEDRKYSKFRKINNPLSTQEIKDIKTKYGNVVKKWDFNNNRFGIGYKGNKKLYNKIKNFVADPKPYELTADLTSADGWMGAQMNRAYKLGDERYNPIKVIRNGKEKIAGFIDNTKFGKGTKYIFSEEFIKGSNADGVLMSTHPDYLETKKFRDIADKAKVPVQGALKNILRNKGVDTTRISLSDLYKYMMGEVGIEGTKNAIEQHHIKGVDVRATGNYQLLDRDLNALAREASKEIKANNLKRVKELEKLGVRVDVGSEAYGTGPGKASSDFLKIKDKVTSFYKTPKGEKVIGSLQQVFNNASNSQKVKTAVALKCLNVAEGGRIGYALGSATIDCVGTKLTNEPVQSSMKLRVTEGIGKIKPAATNFLKLLGKGGAKAAPLAALAAVGAGIEPLVKQFVADDPTTYLTDENQMKGMLLATIEGEKPKVDEEILKWQLPALGAATAAGAIPGAGETYKARRGLPPTKSFVGPMEKGVGPVRSALGIKGVLGKALGATFSPLAVAATLPMDIAAQRKGGTEWGDIATDPLHWMGPAFASTGAEMASKGIKNPILLKALRMGMSPRTLRMVSSKFGLPGLAISAGMWGYDKWKNRSINDDE